MSSCSAAEIAEKKRIALEKLRAKKAQQTIGSSGTINNDKLLPKSTSGVAGMIGTSATVCPPPTLGLAPTSNATNKNTTVPPPAHGLASTSNATNKNTTVPPPARGLAQSSGLSNKNTSNKNTSQPTFNIENKASSFLNAMKGSNVFVQRQQQLSPARDAAHPYKRPPSFGETNNFYKKTPAKGVNEKPHGPLLTATIPCQKVAPVFMNSVSCKVAMISATRFVVQPSAYHAQLVEVFKTIPSKSYDSSTRFWSFALTDYKLVQERVNCLKPDVVMGVIPKAVLNLCLAPPKVLDKSCLQSLEPTLATKLMPFQQEGVCFAISQNGRCLICDEMGLGKTYQALAVADFYRENWPLFICTTASTRDSWANHIRELLPSIPLHYIQVLNSNQQYIGDCKILITSYSMMEKNFSQIMERKFGFLIFDESHSLKNSKSKCTIAADRLCQHAKHVILLSGTPALSRPLELFSQLQMVDKKFMNFIDFTSRYCDGKQSNFGWDANGQSNLEELNVILRLKYMIRRTKSEVLTDLAEKFRETVILDPSLVWPSDEVKESLSTVAKTLQSSKGHEREQILLTFYAKTAEVKARAVCAYIKQIVKEPKKFIVFAHHRTMLDAICECLTKLKVKYVRIDGSTRKQDRGEFIDAFQKKSSCKVAVLSLGACNAGITLTAAELIIFAELTWNPSTLAQAESRAHRIGQRNPVTCRYLMATKTADDHIWNMLKAKQDVLNKAGIFCDNLQDATHTAAPTTSNKIDNFFSPAKAIKCDTTNKSTGDSTDTSTKPPTTVNTIGDLDINKEIENIEDFFQDDDDEAFKDILC